MTVHEVTGQAAAEIGSFADIPLYGETTGAPATADAVTAQQLVARRLVDRTAFTGAEESVPAPALQQGDRVV